KANILRANDAAIYILGPKGEFVDGMTLPDCLVTEKVIDLLNEAVHNFNVVEGKSLVPIKPQSVAPAVKPGSIVLHLTARYLPTGGTWKHVPSEDWIVLDEKEWSKLLPRADAKVGTTWDVDAGLVVKLLSNFYPPSSNRDPQTNRISDPAMR